MFGSRKFRMLQRKYEEKKIKKNERKEKIKIKIYNIVWSLLFKNKVKQKTIFKQQLGVIFTNF